MLTVTLIASFSSRRLLGCHPHRWVRSKSLQWIVITRTHNSLNHQIMRLFSAAIVLLCFRFLTLCNRNKINLTLQSLTSAEVCNSKSGNESPLIIRPDIAELYTNDIFRYAVRPRGATKGAEPAGGVRKLMGRRQFRGRRSVIARIPIRAVSTTL